MTETRKQLDPQEENLRGEQMLNEKEQEINFRTLGRRKQIYKINRSRNRRRRRVKNTTKRIRAKGKTTENQKKTKRKKEKIQTKKTKKKKRSEQKHEHIMQTEGIEEKEEEEEEREGKKRLWTPEVEPMSPLKSDDSLHDWREKEEGKFGHLGPRLAPEELNEKEVGKCTTARKWWGKWKRVKAEKAWRFMPWTDIIGLYKEGFNRCRVYTGSGKRDKSNTKIRTTDDQREMII